MIRPSLRKGFFLLVISFSLILVLTILFLWWFVSTGRHLSYLQGLLEEKTGLDISIGDLDLGKEGIMLRDLKATRMEGGFLITVPSLLIKGGFSAVRGKGPLSVEALNPSVTVNYGFIREKLQGERGRSKGHLIPVDLVVSGGEILVTRKDDEEILGISHVMISLNTRRKSAIKAEGGFRVERYGGYGKFSLNYDLRRSETGRAGLIISGVKLEDFPAPQNLIVSGNLTLSLKVSGMSQGEAGLKIEDLALQKGGGRGLMEGGLLDLKASLGYEDPLKGVSVAGDLSVSEGDREGKVRFEGIYDLIKDSFKIASGEVRLDGRGFIGFRGDIYEIRKHTPEVSIQVVLKRSALKDILRFSGAGAFSEKGISVYGGVRGWFDVKGPLKSPLIRGRLLVERAGIHFSGLDISPLKLSLPITCEVVKGICRTTGASLSSGEAIRGSGDATINLKKGITGNADLRIGLSPGSGPLRDLLDKALPGYSINGAINLSPRIEISVAETGRAMASARGDIGIREGMFSSPNGEIAAEGIGGEGGYTVGWEQDRGLKGEVTLGVKRGEVLAGLFYSDLSASAVSLGIEGRLGKEGHLKVKGAFMDLSGIGRGEFSGGLEGRDGDVMIEDGEGRFSLDAGGAFGLVRDAFGNHYAFLKGTDLRGEIAGKFRMRGLLKSPFISGVLFLKGLNINNKEAVLEVKGLNLRLPLAFGGKDEGALGEGRLTFERAGLGDITLRDGDFPIEVKEGDIFIRKDINIPVFGGDLIGKDLYIRDYAKRERLIHASLELKGLDLEEITRGLKIHPMKGRLSGRIPDLILLGDDLYVDGTVKVSVFGGTVVMENLALKGLLGPVPSLEADISLKDIDLARMTETFDVGRISGILMGYVRNLKVVAGEPERFDLFLETVKRPGVSQKISVKALKKIQILGSGGTMGILDRGIYRLFKEYRYEKIGLRARLRNDTLFLRGIEGEKGREYLVKGGLFPPKVDVISYTQEIPFRELLRRLERIKTVE